MTFVIHSVQTGVRAHFCWGPAHVCPLCTRLALQFCGLLVVWDSINSHLPDIRNFRSCSKPQCRRPRVWRKSIDRTGTDWRHWQYVTYVARLAYPATRDVAAVQRCAHDGRESSGRARREHSVERRDKTGYRRKNTHAHTHIQLFFSATSQRQRLLRLLGSCAENCTSDMSEINSKYYSIH